MAEPVDLAVGLSSAQEDHAPVVSALMEPEEETTRKEAPSEKEQEKPTCRICLDDGDQGSLIRPCLCRGTMQYVHIGCLTEWRTSSGKDNGRGSVVCEQCRFQYVDSVRWHRPIRALLAPVALGIAGGFIQTAPFVLILLWEFFHGTEGVETQWCAYEQESPESSPDIKFFVHVCAMAFRSVAPLLNLPQLSTSWMIPWFLQEPSPLLECMIPRMVTGFLALFILSAGYLVIRIAFTSSPRLRKAKATLRVPAQNLRVLWSLRAGIVVYELISRHVTNLGAASPGFICVLFSGLPFLLPEPLKLDIQDLGDTKVDSPTSSEKPTAPTRL